MAFHERSRLSICLACQVLSGNVDLALLAGHDIVGGYRQVANSERVGATAWTRSL